SGALARGADTLPQPALDVAAVEAAQEVAQRAPQLLGVLRALGLIWVHRAGDELIELAEAGVSAGGWGRRLIQHRRVRRLTRGAPKRRDAAPGLQQQGRRREHV